MSLPRCPRCMTPIQFDWDYCHTCGLSAEEITQGLLAEAQGGAEPLGAPSPADVAALPSIAAYDDNDEDDEVFTAFVDSDDESGDAPSPIESPMPAPSALDRGTSTRAATTGPPAAAAGAFAAVAGAAEHPTPAATIPPAPFSVASPQAIPPGADALPGGGHIAPPAPKPKPSGMSLMGEPLGSPGGVAPPPMPTSGPLLGGSLPKGAIIGGAAMFVLLIVVVVAFGGSKRETTQATTGPTRPPLGAVALDKGAGTLPVSTEVKKYAEGSEGWIVFKPDDGSFAVEFPRVPDDLRLVNVALKGGETQAVTITSRTVGGGYFVAVMDVPDGDEQDVLRDVATGYAKSVDSVVKGGSPSTHYGNPSRDFVVDSNAFQANARAVKMGTRVYVLAAGGTDPTALYWEHLRDTFQPTPGWCCAPNKLQQ